MSEISREELRNKAIRHFECMKNDACVVLDSGFGTKKGESNLVYRNRKTYAEMAINALKNEQKLEKIEHIICDIGECDELADTLENKVYEFCEHYQDDCNKCMIQRIEQIIKG